MSYITFFYDIFKSKKTRKQQQFQRKPQGKQQFTCNWKQFLTMAIFSFSCFYAWFYFWKWDKLRKLVTIKEIYWMGGFKSSHLFIYH